MRIDLNRHSHLMIILLSVLVGMGLMAMVLYLPRAYTPASAQNDEVGVNPGAWQNGFAQVAQAVLPAVVSIQGKAKAENPQQMPPDMEQFFRNLPWFNGPPGGGPGPGSGQRQFPTPQTPRERPFLGSGWIYSQDGLIVTNAHVVKDAASIKVQLHDVEGDPLRTVEVVGLDLRSDLAVLKVKVNRPLPYLQLASSRDAQVGQWVMAVGSPFSENLQQTVTAGIISAKGRVLDAFAQELGSQVGDVIQTDASINPGNSGGPLVDLAGRVVGINESIISPNGPTGGSVGIGFAISSDTAAFVVPQLIQNKKVTRGWLGISIRDLSENMRDFYKAPNGGILVLGVNQDGPAAPSGLKAEDVIVAANGQPLRSTWDLQRVVGESTPGSTVRLSVLRNGQPQDVDVVLGEAPAQAEASATATAQPEQPQEHDPLGLAVQTLRSSMAEAQALNLHGGVLVAQVDPNGAAANVLQPGDAITEVNRQAVSNVADYKAALQQAQQAGMTYVIVRVTHKDEQGQVISTVVDLVPQW